ncbi:aldo/keto reductase [Afifella sp. IM 167]|uniref:aldo/keto reductase n=1 Tax=Afifella sp. IM 167 TaxID=2033586 RepID=UPI001CCCBCFD|nr:aldo/keto reductase [Afifella sp. IM 167]MBZ8132987.1 aldo/keto reductase [Afifella sp. IM 167]
MQQRKLGPFTVSAIGLGCMGLSHAYGAGVDRRDAAALLNRALEIGYALLDTAGIYGFGDNESLIGEVLGPRRDEFVLATKCGVRRDRAGRRMIDGRPKSLKADCEASLKRLRTDVIDLCYLHRWDKNVPIEDSMGALAELVTAGKIKTIGLCEVSAATLLRAHAVHPVSAVQSEYSLWTRNPEIAMLAACRQLDITFVAFAPLGRGFLTGALSNPDALADGDLRRSMPRFQAIHFYSNLALIDGLREIAEAAGCTMGQLALAWLLGKGDDIVPIPGTSSLAHLEENRAAVDLDVPPGTFLRLDRLINEDTVAGERYALEMLREVDSEAFANQPGSS